MLGRLILSFPLLPVGLLNAQNLHVKDQKTGEPIPYCNLQVKNKDFGRVSNEQGIFELSDSIRERIEPTDTILLSSVGYKKKAIDGAELQEKMKNSNAAHLSPKAVQKDSIEVVGYDKTDVRIGRKVENNAGEFGFDVSEIRTGSEVGSVINVRRPFTELETFGLYVTRSSKGDDSVLVRLNLYDLNEDADTVTERVDSLINKEPIRFHIPMKEGPTRVDISEHNLTVHEDFLATIEVLDKTYAGESQLFLATRMLGKGTIHKNGLGKPWQKFPVISVAFYFEGRMPTWWDSFELEEVER